MTIDKREMRELDERGQIRSTVSATDFDVTRANSWGAAMWIAPLLALAAVWAVANYLFGTSILAERLTPLQAFLFLCAMFFPMAAAFYARSQWNFARARLAHRWPTVRGVVKSSRVSKRLSSRTGWSYRLHIDYSYKVGEQEFSGDRVAFGQVRVWDEDYINRLAEKYRTGAEAIVRYDPADPEMAVLETSVESARVYESDDKVRAIISALLPLFLGVVIALTAILDPHSWDRPP